MLVQGLQPVQPGARPIDQPLQLHLNQKVTAEILSVNGEQIEMVIQGYRVVGRLQTNDQSAMLENNQLAQFIVKGSIDGVLQLAIAKSSEIASPAQPTSKLSLLTQNLLILNNIEVTDQNIILGKALLNHGLSITPGAMEDLTQALAGISNWGQTEADMAAALKAGGMPLTENTLSLALQTLPSMAVSVSKLQNQLVDLAKGQAGSEIGKLANQALSLLQSATIDWSKDLPALLDDLKQAISVWGKSLESELARQASGDKVESTESWLSLIQLRKALESSGYRSTVRSIDQFMEGVRQMQFLNTARPIENGNPPWLLVNLPVAAHIPGQPAQQGTFFPASLRIAYRTQGKVKRIDPDNTRLVLTVDLQDGEYVTADLSVIGKRVGAWLSVSTDELREQAVATLPDLQERLGKLGLSLKVANCVVASVGPVLSEENAEIYPGSKGIDIEV
ncbi:MAG: hypothetical protein GYA15_01270 [Leptolinea sp.]|jgi:hypothetical protein|nr:hypothetical protein [Leptolinea sp.]